MTHREGFSIGNFVALDEKTHPDFFGRVHNDALPWNGAERSGVESRLIAKADALPVDTARAALEELLNQSGIQREMLGGLVVVNSINPDPDALAKQVAEKSDIDPNKAVGVSFECSGFVKGIKVAQDIASKKGGLVPVVHTEHLSKHMNWEPTDGSDDDDARARAKAPKILGDATVAYMAYPDVSTGDFQILNVHTDTIEDPRGLIQMVEVQDPQLLIPTRTPGEIHALIKNGVHRCLHMPGKSGLLLMKAAPKAMVAAVQRATSNGDSYGVDRVIPHQANSRMEERIRTGLEEVLTQVVQPEVYMDLTETGNTASASIPLALAQLLSIKDFKKGEIIAMPSAGGYNLGNKTGPTGSLSTGCVLAKVNRH